MTKRIVVLLFVSVLTIIAINTVTHPNSQGLRTFGFVISLLGLLIISSKFFSPPKKKLKLYPVYRSEDNELINMDTSDFMCTMFGFYYKQRVKTPLGNATVVGMAFGTGLYRGIHQLWFLIDGEQKVRYWPKGQAREDFEKIGIVPLEEAA